MAKGEVDRAKLEEFTEKLHRLGRYEAPAFTSLPKDSEERKGIPIYEGVIRYFPAALAEVARLSKAGNDKHNPGEPLHHARGKSMDHRDCIIRHLIDSEEIPFREDGIAELASVAWRALALLQEFLEEHRDIPMAPGARNE